MSDVKKLHDLAKTYTELDEIEYFDLPDIQKFILDKDLKPGDTRILSYLVYYEYMKWANFNPSKTSMQFFKAFNKIFPRKFFVVAVTNTASVHEYYYNLDPSSFDLTPEYMQHAKVEVFKKKYKDKEKLERRKKAQERKRAAKKEKI